MKAMWVVLTMPLVVLIMATAAVSQAPEPGSDTAQSGVDSTQTAPSSTYTTVTYFHGDKRCPTCLKLEAYSRAAVEQGFADSLASGSLVWQMINYDREENQHFVDDYQLFTKALVISRVVEGKETAWKNLDQIWTLVGDETKFIEYVQKETAAFLAGTTGE